MILRLSLHWHGHIVTTGTILIFLITFYHTVQVATVRFNTIDNCRGHLQQIINVNFVFL